MILGIDTATEWINAAVVAGDKAWTRRILTNQASTSSMMLLPLVDELLDEAGVGPVHNARTMHNVNGCVNLASGIKSGITGVVVCIGPGGFTSLRVGIATADGLAVLGLPTWGFSSFELRARSLKYEGWDGIVYLALDGQRGEVFLQPWDLEKMQGLEPAAKIPLAGLHSAIGDNNWWAQERLRSTMEHYVGHTPVVHNDEGVATKEALVSLCRFYTTRPPEALLAPFYLRETDAEVNFPAASVHLKDEHRRGVAR